MRKETTKKKMMVNTNSTLMTGRPRAEQQTPDSDLQGTYLKTVLAMGGLH